MCILQNHLYLFVFAFVLTLCSRLHGNSVFKLFCICICIVLKFVFLCACTFQTLLSPAWEFRHLNAVTSAQALSGATTLSTSSTTASFFRLLHSFILDPAAKML